MKSTAIALALLATPATAAQCGKHVDIIAGLDSAYGETVQFQGYTKAPALVQFFANTKTGTWSILVARPDGAACIIGVGQGWHAVKQGEPT